MVLTHPVELLSTIVRALQVFEPIDEEYFDAT